MMRDEPLIQITQAKLSRAVTMKAQWLTQHEENWRLYRNDYAADDETKETWQSCGYMPYMTDMVDRMVGAILEGFLAAQRRLFELNTGHKARAAVMVALVGQELAAVRFDEVLDEALLEAMLGGYAVAKDSWDKDRGCMRLQVVDPLDFYRVPDGRDGFVEIEAVTMERGELERLGEEGYDPDRIKKALDAPGGGASDGDRAQIEAAKKDQQGLTTERYAALQRPVVVYDCWGRLYDDEGKRVGDPVEDPILSWAMCNNQVIRPPEKSPYWDGRSPFSFGYIKRVQNTPYPYSVVRDHAVLQRSMTRLVNAIADKIYMRRVQWVVWRGQVAQHQIAGGLKEGKVWKQLHPGPIALQAVSSNLPMEPEFQMLAVVERAMQSMGMTETGMGQPTTRGRPTLGEIQQRMGASTAFLGSIARRFERSFIHDVVRRAIVNILQFKLDGPSGSGSNPRYAENVVGFLGGERLAVSGLDASDVERKNMLKQDFAEIRVRGVSDQVSKGEKAEGLNYFLRMFTQLMQTAISMAQATESPEMQQEAAKLVRMVSLSGILYDAAEMTGFEPEHVLAPDALLMVAEADAGRPEAGAMPGGIPPETGGTPEIGEMPGIGQPVAAGRRIWD